MSRIIVANNYEETIALGRAVGETLRQGDVVCLYGELGAGKTALSKGIALALGIKEPIRSPTFTIIHEHRGKILMNHVDLYRLTTLDEVVDLALDETYPNGVTVIEWADKAMNALPPDRLDIAIETLSDTARRFILTDIGIAENLSRLIYPSESKL